MTATKPVEQKKEDSRRDHGELDNRYGKIGISAVAAAVRCKGEERKQKQETREPYDRD